MSGALDKVDKAFCVIKVIYFRTMTYPRSFYGLEYAILQMANLHVDGLYTTHQPFWVFDPRPRLRFLPINLSRRTRVIPILYFSLNYNVFKVLYSQKQVVNILFYLLWPRSIKPQLYYQIIAKTTRIYGFPFFYLLAALLDKRQSKSEGF